MMHWPRTLFGRNLLLLIGILIASQATWLIAYRLFVQGPRLDRMAGYVREQEETLRLALQTIPPARRQHMLDTLVQTHPERLRRADASTMLPEPSMLAALRIAQLQRAIGSARPMRWEGGLQRRLWVLTTFEGQNYWMSHQAFVLLPEAGELLLITSLLTVLFAALGAAFIQRHLHRPLRDLACAADAVAAGQPLPALTAQGPSEVARVAASFTRMAQALARADSERTLMLAGVSHDLRTPLAKLRLCVEMLRAGNEPELIESMTRNIDTADATIGQFVDFARIGSQEAEQLCDLAELVRSVVADSRPFHDIRIEVAALVPCTVRPVALRRALANLLENAQRYAPGSVELSLAESPAGIAIRVLDRGPGIPPAELARVRQPFVRLDEARGRRPGAGLGLAIVERIAALHGGHLELAPREGGGLAATLLLPRNPA